MIQLLCHKIIKKFIFPIVCLVLFTHHAIAASFVPRISLSEEYNDNIELNERDAKSDWIIVVSPGFAAEAETRIIGATLNYDFSHSSYQENSENDANRHTAFLDSWVRLTRYTEVGLNNRFVQTEETGSIKDSTEIRNSREPFYENSASADINHIFGDQRSINLEYSYNILENEDDDVEDNSSHDCSLSLNYMVIPHLSLETEASYTKGEYDISPGFVNIEGRTRVIKTISNRFDVFIEYSHTDFNNDTEDSIGDYRIYNPSIGTNLLFGDGGTFSINTGYFIQERDSSENESGLTIEGDLGKQWQFRHGSISFTGNSGYENSQLGSENLGFNIYYQAAIGAEYSFTRYFRYSLNSSYRFNDYVNPDDDQTDRKDGDYNVITSLSWQAKQWLNTNLAYRYRSRESNIDDNDYVENSIILRLSFVLDNN